MRSHSLPRLLAVFVVLGCALPSWSQSNIVSCNSDDMGYHTCYIGPNRGVTVYRQHSHAQCIEGQTFGVRGEQIWVNRGCRADFQVNTRGGGNWNQGGATASFSCSSDDMHMHYCALPGRGQVRMVHQRSEAQCIEGQTWGVRGGQLWVDRGCRADFELLARENGGHRDRDWDRDRDDHHDHDGYNNNYDNNNYGARTVTCSSDDMRRHSCDVGPNGGIRLVRQRSEARCELNRTYGLHGNQIWVDRGCRADFEVVPPGHRPHRQ